MNISLQFCALVATTFLLFNSCGGYYFSENYKIKYASESIRGGTEIKMNSNDLLILDRTISEVCEQYDINKISIRKAKGKASDEPKGHILLAYCSCKDSINFNLVLLTERILEQWINRKKIKYYYYYLYLQSYSENGGGTDEYTRLKSEIIQRFRNEFGKNSIINVKELFSSGPVPYEPN